MNEYRDEIAACCKKLRLSQKLYDRSLSIDCESNQEFLYCLLKSEIEYREKTRIAKYTHSAAFPPVAYDFTKFRSDEISFQDTSLDELLGLEFYRSHKNLIMYGGTGTGKTMLSVWIGREACKQGIPVRFYRTAALINKFTEHHAKGSLDTFRSRLKKNRILILDEFGFIPYDRTGSQLLFDYISEAEAEQVFILSTNLEFSRWVNILYDEQMTAALIGRLTHHCHLLLFPGQNNWLRESSINEIYQAIAAHADRKEDNSHV